MILVRTKLQKLIKLTKEYKLLWMAQRGGFFHSPQADGIREELNTLYEELRPIVQKYIGWEPHRDILGNGHQVKIFDHAYSEADPTLSFACIKIAPEILNKVLIRLNHKRIPTPVNKPNELPYINPEIIKTFKNKKGQFDYRKLIALLNEINDNYLRKNSYSIVYLIRAVLDHIPPLVECRTFDQMVNDYRGNEPVKKALKVLHRWRYTPNAGLHEAISNTDAQIDMSDVPEQILLKRLLTECLDKAGSVKLQPVEGKPQTQKNKLKIDLLESRITWAHYAVARWTWNCFRIALMIDNADNDKPDFIEPLLIAKVGGVDWKLKHYFFGSLTSANSQFKIDGNDMKQESLFISHLDFGNRDRTVQMPMFDQGSVKLIFNSRRGAHIEIPIKNEWVQRD